MWFANFLTEIKMSPRQQLGVFFFLVLILAAVCLYLALRIPALGIQWSGNHERQGLTIAAVHFDGAAAKAGLKTDTQIVAIRSVGSPETQLEYLDILEEPDVIPKFEAINRFFSRQDILHRHLQAENITLVSKQGETFTLIPQQRLLTNLPAVFWFQIFCGLVAVMTGLAVFSFKRSDASAALFAATGCLLMLVTFASSIYSTRELALDGSLFMYLSILNHLGSLLFTAAFASLFWHYPQRLSKWPVALTLFAIYTTLWVADTLQWMPDTDTSLRLPILAGLLLSFVFAAMQWRFSRHNPIQRMALKWFILAILIGGSFFVAALFLLKLQAPGFTVSQGYSFGLLLIMYLGIAMGISRYGLFQLGVWWATVWHWLLGGFVVVALDLMLVYWLHWQQSLALGLSVALAGWLYFPIRQWLMKRWQKQGMQSLESLFPRLVNLVLQFEPHDRLSREWQGFLHDTFLPLHIEIVPMQTRNVVIDSNGANLTIPDVTSSSGFRLAYPDKGARLYTRQDLQLACSLWEILSHVLSGRNNYEAGVSEERKRLARDLHDDIGTRLLSLIHRAEKQEVAALAREAMSDLRIVLTNLDGKDRLLLDALADWRNEWQQRCDTRQVQLVWAQSIVNSSKELTARQYANILRVLRETLSNSLKHSRPHEIAVLVSDEINRLKVRIEHDGLITQPKEWKKGRGTLGIQHRMHELGGSVNYQSDISLSRLVVELILPWSSSETPNRAMDQQ